MTIIRVILPNAAKKMHLQKVTKVMKKRGPPHIRILWHPEKDAFVALEGSHRLTAAKNLGLKPTFTDVTGEKRIYISCFLPFVMEKVSPELLLSKIYLEESPILEFEQ